MKPRTDRIFRQPYLSDLQYTSTIDFLRKDSEMRIFANKDIELGSIGLVNNCFLISESLWSIFQLRYTAGVDLTVLAIELENVVKAFANFRQAHDASPESDHHCAFPLEDIIDRYVDYVNLLSVAICLHREDLIPHIFELIKDSPYDGTDLVIEELLLKYLPNRPDIDVWCFDRPYRKLLEAAYAKSPGEQAKGMKKYVQSWYPSMKGRALLWGQHEKSNREITSHCGYWAMCSAAFTFLYSIDDTSYRDELTYPKDLADYARKVSRRNPEEALRKNSSELLMIAAGELCPSSGFWFSPDEIQEPIYLNKLEVMPSHMESKKIDRWYKVRW